MSFVHIDDADFIPAHAFKQELKVLNKRNPFHWICLTQQLLTLFPTQATCLEEVAQGSTADWASPSICDPAAQLLEGPAMTR